MAYFHQSSKTVVRSFLNSCLPYFNGVQSKLNKNIIPHTRNVVKLINSSQSPFLCREYATLAVRPQTITKDDKRDFMALFPDIVRDLTRLEPEISDLGPLIAKIMQYNVHGGKKVRGLTVVYSYRMLADESFLTPENIRLSQIIGWCIEMMQGYFLVIDDIVDDSLTRRGRPCWYKVDDVGYRAISDAILLNYGALQLIKQNCRDKPYYVDLMELFVDGCHRTFYGQTLDCISVFPMMKFFNMDRYSSITRYKTSYYTFYLPVAAAMYMAGITNPELHRQAKIVLLEMGHYFQVQDDYLDVFGDEETTGKIGTDIRDGKCTWLAIIAFQRASDVQREILQKSYGSFDPEKIETVKEIFRELGLPSMFHAYEEETYNLITRQIQQLSQGLPHELFLTLLHKIHRRIQ